MIQPSRFRDLTNRNRSSSALQHEVFVEVFANRQHHDSSLSPLNSQLNHWPPSSSSSCYPQISSPAPQAAPVAPHSTACTHQSPHIPDSGVVGRWVGRLESGIDEYSVLLIAGRLTVSYILLAMPLELPPLFRNALTRHTNRHFEGSPLESSTTVLSDPPGQDSVR